MLTSNGIIMVWLWIFVLLFHVSNGEDIEVFRVKRVDKKCCLTVNETAMFTQNVEKCYTTGCPTSIFAKVNAYISKNKAGR